MKIMKLLLALVFATSLGWCEEKDRVLENCMRIERGFLGLKEVSIYVFDNDEDEDLQRLIAKEIHKVFSEYHEGDRSLNYAAGPAQLNVFLNRENNECTISIILLGEVDAQPGLLFIDCFCVTQREIIPAIQKKIARIIADFASGGSYPIAFVPEAL